jgi:hypothetical protein
MLSCSVLSAHGSIVSSHDQSLSLQVLPQVMAILPSKLLHLHLSLRPRQYACPRLTSKPRPDAATKALHAAAAREMWLFSFQVATTSTHAKDVCLLWHHRVRTTMVLAALTRGLLLHRILPPQGLSLCYHLVFSRFKNRYHTAGYQYRKLPNNSKAYLSDSNSGK